MWNLHNKNIFQILKLLKMFKKRMFLISSRGSKGAEMGRFILKKVGFTADSKLTGRAATKDCP